MVISSLTALVRGGRIVAQRQEPARVQCGALACGTLVLSRRRETPRHCRILGHASRMAMKGKVGLICGVVNKSSIAWAVAQSWRAAGCEVVLTYQDERARSKVERLVAAEWGDEAAAGCASLLRRYSRIDNWTDRQSAPLLCVCWGWQPAALRRTPRRGD